MRDQKIEVSIKKSKPKIEKMVEVSIKKYSKYSNVSNPNERAMKNDENVRRRLDNNRK